MQWFPPLPPWMISSSPSTSGEAANPQSGRPLPRTWRRSRRPHGFPIAGVQRRQHAPRPEDEHPVPFHRRRRARSVAVPFGELLAEPALPELLPGRRVEAERELVLPGSGHGEGAAPCDRDAGEPLASRNPPDHRGAFSRPLAQEPCLPGDAVPVRAPPLGPVLSLDRVRPRGQRQQRQGRPRRMRQAVSAFPSPVSCVSCQLLLSCSPGGRSAR